MSSWVNADALWSTTPCTPLQLFIPVSFVSSATLYVFLASLSALLSVQKWSRVYYNLTFNCNKSIFKIKLLGARKNSTESRQLFFRHKPWDSKIRITPDLSSNTRLIIDYRTTNDLWKLTTTSQNKRILPIKMYYFFPLIPYIFDRLVLMLVKFKNYQYAL